MLAEFVASKTQYLWQLHWAFRINPFYIPYFIIGPGLIWYTKPQMSISKRYCFIILAFIFSCYIFLESVLYNDALDNFAYETCVKLLPNPDPLQRHEECKSHSLDAPPSLIDLIYSLSPTLCGTLMLIAALLCSPFWGGVRLAWRIYHRKTIKEMGPTYEDKLLDDVLIVASIFWILLCGPLIMLLCILCVPISILLNYINILT